MASLKFGSLSMGEPGVDIVTVMLGSPRNFCSWDESVLAPSRTKSTPHSTNNWFCLDVTPGTVMPKACEGVRGQAGGDLFAPDATFRDENVLNPNLDFNLER